MQLFTSQSAKAGVEVSTGVRVMMLRGASATLRKVRRWEDQVNRAARHVTVVSPARTTETGVVNENSRRSTSIWLDICQREPFARNGGGTHADGSRHDSHGTSPRALINSSEPWT
jgi:hypothetical protein